MTNAEAIRTAVRDLTYEEKQRVLLMMREILARRAPP